MDNSLIEYGLRLLLACIAGMAIGLEREWREKAAGFRTITLVSLGTATFVLAATDLAPDSTARALAGVATGVGFLGAGAILQERGQVQGLTTAAAVWMAAALGVSAAIGAYSLTAFGLVAALGVLLLLPIVNLANLQQDARRYEIEYSGGEWPRTDQATCLEAAGLTYSLLSIAVSGDRVCVTWQTFGRRAQHEKAISLLAADDAVIAFKAA